MENISMLTDFDGSSSTGKFEKINSPAGLEDYSIFIGGNFIFISNAANRTIRFSLANFNTHASEQDIQDWIRRIRSFYPNF